MTVQASSSNNKEEEGVVVLKMPGREEVCYVTKIEDAYKRLELDKNGQKIKSTVHLYSFQSSRVKRAVFV